MEMRPFRCLEYEPGYEYFCNCGQYLGGWIRAWLHLEVLHRSHMAISERKK